MIISHKHRFLFFAIPKTGTHSVRFALRPFLGNQDEEHVSLFAHSRLSVPMFKDRANGHFSVSEIRPHIPNEIWDTYFKFCFVRNPWDRFVSSVFFKNPDSDLLKRAPRNVMQLVIEAEKRSPRSFYKSQTSYLLNDTGGLGMDFIGKVENMQADFDTICDRINIPRVILDKHNTSTHNYYRDYYTETLSEQVAEFYADDIRNFKYSWDSKL